MIQLPVKVQRERKKKEAAPDASHKVTLKNIDKVDANEEATTKEVERSSIDLVTPAALSLASYPFHKFVGIIETFESQEKRIAELSHAGSDVHAEISSLHAGSDVHAEISSLHAGSDVHAEI